jgi:hypothetical protein
MAKEIQTGWLSGKTIYAILSNPTGSVWNTNTSAFEAYATANRTSYAITLTEQGTASGIYMGDVPSIPIGQYGVIAYVQAGGSPNESDEFISSGNLDWNGTAIWSPGDIRLCGGSTVAAGAIPNAAAAAAGGLPTVDANNNVHGVQPGTGTGQINPSGGKVPATLAAADVTGNVAADLQTIKTQTVTCAGSVTVGAFVGQANAAISVSGAGHISNVDTLTTYTNNTPQTGDAFARLGAPAGASISADIAEIAAETDGIASIPTNPLLASNVPANFAALGISSGGHISVVDTLTGNTPQTGDSFARLGAPAGASVSADIAEVEGETDAIISTLASGVPVTGNVTVGSNLDKTGYSLNLTEAVPLVNAPNTVGDALNAARAQGFGKWVIDTIANTFTLYAPDGTTVVRQFVLDSVITPRSRT